MQCGHMSSQHEPFHVNLVCEGFSLFYWNIVMKMLKCKNENLMTSYFGTLYSSGPARVLVCGPFNSSATSSCGKDLCCSLSLETCKREQHNIWNHMTDKRTILEYDSSSYWCARGGGGVALTQLSGRYVPPEVKKVGSAERIVGKICV